MINSIDKPMEFFKSKKFIWLLAFIWTAIILALSCWKYAHNLFNGLDLAIYNQAMFNTIHGRIMELSIHPNNYFGDHFEPILFLLVPFYALVQHPLTLVFLQTIMIAVTVWPIYKIAQKFLTGYWPTFMVASWLFNPFVHSASMFEFHALVFSACLLIWAIYFYKYERYLPWLITIGLVLLTREDAALSVIAFSFIALIEKKHWRWYLPTFIVAVVYFVLSMKLITYLSPDNHYKFITYYQWLGNTPKEIIINALIHPWLVLIKLFRFQNFILLLSLLMPTAFIALYRPKWLLLSLPTFLGYALTGVSSASIVLVTHYTIILLPGYFLASLDSLEAIIKKLDTDNDFYIPVLKIVIGVSLVYSIFAIGLGKVVYEIKFQDYKHNLVGNNLVINKDDTIIAPFGLLTFYSSLKNVYSLNYLLTGHKQLSAQPFVIPKTNWLAIDNNDMIYFSATKPNSVQWKMWWDTLDDNLRNRVNEMNLTKLTPEVAYFSNATSSFQLVSVLKSTSLPFSATAIKTQNISDDFLVALNIKCEQSENNKVIQIDSQLKDNKHYTYNVPYLWGLYRSSDCNDQTIYQQLISVPKNTVTAKITVNKVNIETKINSLGTLTITPQNSTPLNTVNLDFE